MERYRFLRTISAWRKFCSKFLLAAAAAAAGSDTLVTNLKGKPDGHPLPPSVAPGRNSSASGVGSERREKFTHLRRYVKSEQEADEPLLRAWR